MLDAKHRADRLVRIIISVTNKTIQPGRDDGGARTTDRLLQGFSELVENLTAFWLRLKGIETDCVASGDSHLRNSRATVIGNYSLRGLNSPEDGNVGLSQDMLDDGFLKSRCVIFKVQAICFLIQPKALQSISVREFPESPELLRRERLLQIVGGLHESHGGIITEGAA